MHPSGSRFSIFIALVKSSRGIRIPKKLRPLFSAPFDKSPLSATADPENDRFQAVSKDKRQLSWLRMPAFQWLTAWSVKMEISDSSGRNGSPFNVNGLPSKTPGFPFQPIT